MNSDVPHFFNKVYIIFFSNPFSNSVPTHRADTFSLMNHVILIPNGVPKLIDGLKLSSATG